MAPRALIPVKARYAGGDVSLLRLPGGRWIVSSWFIRMPVVARTAVRGGDYELRGYHEIGGTVDPVGPPVPPP